jgi:MFS family permease
MKASEPVATKRVGWGFIAVYALAYTGTWLALLTPVLVTIALRVRQLAPTNAAQSLSLILGIGACCALIAGPVFGRLSDRTTSRFGMRRPWLVGGVLCGFAALLFIATADSLAAILVGWCIAQLAFNAVLASIVALLPDQVPLEQRGTVSGVLGICMPIGQVAGTFLVQAVSGSMLLAFMLPATIGAVSVLLLALVMPDRRLEAKPAAQPWRELLAAFWVSPRRHRNFGWAWLSRFLLGVGAAFVSTYQPFLLLEKLGSRLEAVPSLIFKAMLVQSSLVVVVSLVSGELSDRLARRRGFVFLGACIYTCGLWTVAMAGSYPAFVYGMAIIGVGHGMYFAVDLALVTEVLPDQQRDAAKDLGILNIANALPQAVAPAIGAVILNLADANYTWLYLAAGVIALSSAGAIVPMRAVR